MTDRLPDAPTDAYAPPGAVDAMTERRVSRLPVGWKHGCDGRDCPLR